MTCRGVFQRLADVIVRDNAQLWIEHDKIQNGTRKLHQITTTDGCLAYRPVQSERPIIGARRTPLDGVVKLFW
jgi:hypothetical protein